MSVAVAAERPAGLADDIRECPATWALAASWVLVFALMHLVQWQTAAQVPAGGFANPLPISGQVSHRFGTMTWAEVRHGEVWRLVTATFVHLSLVHVGMNVFGLIKLGQLMEPWYGSGPFLAVCLAMGGLGNLVGGMMRQAVTSGKAALAGSSLAQAWPRWFEGGGPEGINASYQIQSGGGSTILLGLLGLGAVVGWRSKTRIGSFLRDQMVAMLVFTGIIGVVLINLLDNYGHAGGAIVGAGFGFIHRPLIRVGEASRIFRRGCWAGAVALTLACVVAAARDDRAEAGFRTEFKRTEARSRLDQAILGDLDRVSIFYARTYSMNPSTGDPMRELDQIAVEPLLRSLVVAPLPSTPGPIGLGQWRTRTQVELRGALQALGSHPGASWGASTAADLADLTALGRVALDQPPAYDQLYAFTVTWLSARREILLDLDRSRLHLVQLERRAERGR